MKKAFRAVISFFLLLLLVWLAYLNFKLYHQPDFVEYGKVEINQDVLDQLRFLKTEIQNGAADEMQNEYPEGFVFMNVLYGLSWCEIAGVADHQSALFKEAHDEIQFSYDQVNSQKAKAIFERELSIPYGAFYSGWNNYLLGKKLSVEDSSARDSSEITQYNSQCAQIVHALQKSETPFPESYPHASWPSDAVVAAASVTLESKIEYPVRTDGIKTWIDRVKLNLDPHGLIPHSVEYVDGKPRENARGGSQSLMLSFLFDIDSLFAQEQFEIYKEKFLTTRFGLPAICEFPKGEEGQGDVDSGPIIFGMGSAATIVGLRTMTTFGESSTAIALRNSIDAFGFAFTSDGEKKFLFGKVLMADAFVAWANSKEITKGKMLSTNEHWRWKFQLYSSLIFMFLLFLILKINSVRIRFKRAA